MAVNLGDRVKDSITGYEGIVTAITHYLHGCVRVVVEGRSEDGKPTEAQAFDVQRVDPGPGPQKKGTGGDPARPRTTSAQRAAARR